MNTDATSKITRLKNEGGGIHCQKTHKKLSRLQDKNEDPRRQDVLLYNDAMHET